MTALLPGRRVPPAVSGDMVRPGVTPTHMPGLLGPMLAALLVPALVWTGAAVLLGMEIARGGGALQPARSSSE